VFQVWSSIVIFSPHENWTTPSAEIRRITTSLICRAHRRDRC
jgi:hypothetical protein